MTLGRIAAASITLLAYLAAPVSAQSVVGWRSDGTGVFPEAAPPTHWSKTENVCWYTELPGRSNAQPIVVGDRIFVCAEPFRLMCLDRQTGHVLWERDHAYERIVGEEAWQVIAGKLVELETHRKQLNVVETRIEELAEREPVPVDAKAKLEQTQQRLQEQVDDLSEFERYELPRLEQPHNGYTTATPVSDGQSICVVFGHRVVACYDLEGRRQWLRVLEDHPHEMWGHSSSPVLVDGKLIVNIEDTVALDVATGDELWRTRYGQSWGSPTTAWIGEQPIVLLANGRILDARNGRILCRVGQLAYSSPFVRDGVAYYVGVRTAAYRLPDDLNGPLDPERFEPEELWSELLKGGQFYASSILHEGRLYAVSTKHILNVIDATSGETLYVERLDLGGEPTWTSLCLAGGHLFVTSRGGTTIVFAPGDQYREVARNQLEPLISNPLFHERAIYVRTHAGLYCLADD